jgi:hypothetical protein
MKFMIRPPGTALAEMTMARIAALSGAERCDHEATTRDKSRPIAPAICARICVLPFSGEVAMDCVSATSEISAEGSIPFTRSKP